MPLHFKLYFSSFSITSPINTLSVSLFLEKCKVSGGSYTSGGIEDGANAFGYWNHLNKLLNVPIEWVSEGAELIALNENTDDISFAGSCDILIPSINDNFDCASVETCLDLTSDEISSDICFGKDNVVRGSNHNCFSIGFHHAWCGIDSNGNAAVAECDIPFQYVHKIEVRNSPFVYEYVQGTTIVMLPSVGKNYVTPWLNK